MLAVRDLVVNYGARKVLKGVSLDVRRGEIVALIGANGAGKTTLIKTICGLNSPVSGTIEFDGRKTSGLSPDRIVQGGISCVPEGRQLFPQMTVKENLDMGAFTRKDTQKIEKDLNRVYELFPILKERSRELAGGLSGGQQQMLAIGRGLMGDPKFLIIDETSFGLAPLVVQSIMEIIRELNKEGMTVLLVEQNAMLALEISQRAYVLENGTINLTGQSDELINNDHVIRAYLGG